MSGKKKFAMKNNDLFIFALMCLVVVVVVVAALLSAIDCCVVPFVYATLFDIQSKPLYCML